MPPKLREIDFHRLYLLLARPRFPRGAESCVFESESNCLADPEADGLAVTHRRFEAPLRHHLEHGLVKLDRAARRSSRFAQVPFSSTSNETTTAPSMPLRSAAFGYLGRLSSSLPMMVGGRVGPFGAGGGGGGGGGARPVPVPPSTPSSEPSCGPVSLASASSASDSLGFSSGTSSGGFRTARLTLGLTFGFGSGGGASGSGGGGSGSGGGANSTCVSSSSAAWLAVAVCTTAKAPRPKTTTDAAAIEPVMRLRDCAVTAFLLKSSNIRLTHIPIAVRDDGRSLLQTPMPKP